jgi:aspartyl/asparaginyl beta-hydroxylase (cupin superfamily)
MATAVREDPLVLARLRHARALSQQGRDAASLEELEALAHEHPTHEGAAIACAVARAHAGLVQQALQGLDAFVQRNPVSPLAWLLAGQMREDEGQLSRALAYRLQASKYALAAGVWHDPQSTPPHLVDAVRHAICSLRSHRSQVLHGTVDTLEKVHGAETLVRVRRAVAGYLKEQDETPPDPMQRPRFLYVPGLPSTPYLDTSLQPWASRLENAFAEVREEALSVLLEGQSLQDFIEVRTGDDIANYLGGVKPSWEAFFFYRHGQRFDDNHARCPKTSALLESIDLVRIPGQTPEVCFSVLTPGTHILPHYGVTNARSVMHLPLVVPADCALNLVGHGERHWQEGVALMFDDTYLHEAWNHSNSPRMILLMDCWNPHLTAVEREAVVLLSEAIGVIDVGLANSGWH